MPAATSAAISKDAVICYGTGFIVNFDSFYVKKFRIYDDITKSECQNGPGMGMQFLVDVEANYQGSMASGNSTQQNFRKAIGALKDSTKVGIARVNSEYKGLDVAIVKATNHDEMLPKQKHMRTIFNSVCASSPRADVAYCIHALARRLAKTHTWTVCSFDLLFLSALY
ncbi:hypothetical protein M9H77_06629 [Catharanthus roseus]|uniref:Uncharacterized protein n=1 Tax=Catharanthus roseus TaxID=4058 RepID=A0ACC0BSM5_CATRO|nr:hypothetical protein M9H77_06629 [Catharanthus roseus]